jgi:hypothetical protein
MTTKKHKRHVGSALPEYVVPLVLVVSATIAVVPSGGGLSTWFQGVIGQTTGGSVNGGQLVIEAGKQIVPPPAPTVPSGPGQQDFIEGGVTGKQTDDTTSPPEAPAIASPVASSNTPLIETAGGLGGVNTIYALADSITREAQKMKMAGAPDWLTNFITDVAKYGHTDMGDTLKTAWTSCPPDQPCSTDWTTFGASEARAQLMSQTKQGANGTYTADKGFWAPHAYNGLLNGSYVDPTGGHTVHLEALNDYPESKAVILSLVKGMIDTAQSNASAFNDRAAVVRASGNLSAKPPSSGTTTAQNTIATGTITDNANGVCTTGGDGQTCMRP